MIHVGITRSMYYVIQEKVFKEIHYNRILDAVKRVGLDYEVVCLHQADFVPSQTSRKDVFCFGSIKLARLAEQRNWTPGSLMNENHDYEVYAAYWNEHLLNADSTVQAFEAPITFRGKRFIRPTKDSKLFTGKVFSREDWLMTQRAIARYQKRNRSDDSDRITKEYLPRNPLLGG